MALDYGADIVYSEEIIDKSILATERSVNSKQYFLKQKNYPLRPNNELKTKTHFPLSLFYI
jgi:hypothetical protein